MNEIKYNRLRNKVLFQCWLIINVILSTAYIIEVINGNRTLYYVTQFLLIDWIPFIFTYMLSIKIGKDNVKIKYIAATFYILFYMFVMFTSNSLGTFCYILPMLCALLIYSDIKLVDITSFTALCINIIYVVYKIIESNYNIQSETVTFFEIQIACLILCMIFLHKTSKIIAYGNNKLNKLTEDIEKDELTGAHNRKFLSKFLEEKFKNTKFSEVSLAIIDVDDFKAINDTYGHKIGDLVLKEIVNIIKDNLEGINGTHLVRIGGDEFVIISNVIDKEQLTDICNKTCDIISETKLRSNTQLVNFTVSIGIASTEGFNKDDYLELYERADEMMYTVKNTGKNSVAVDNQL